MMFNEECSGIEDTFLKRQGKWHKICALKYNSTVSERAKNWNFEKARMMTCHQHHMVFVIDYQLLQMCAASTGVCLFWDGYTTNKD